MTSHPTPPGEDPLLERIRQLERRVSELETADQLDSASIGSGGLQVRNGQIVILDAAGDPQLTLSTEGLTLTGLLEMLGGTLEWKDAADARRVRIRGDADDSEGGNLTVWSAGAAQPEVVIGTIYNEGTSTIFGYGLLVQREDDVDLLKVWSADGEPSLVEVKDGHGNFVLQASDNFDQYVQLHDTSGNLRSVLGALATGNGLLVQLANGDDVGEISSRLIVLNRPDASRQILMIDNTGLWVDVEETAGGTRQNGYVTAGPADSGGAGFRTLRIPN